LGGKRFKLQSFWRNPHQHSGVSSGMFTRVGFIQGRGPAMEFELESNRKWRLLSLMLTAGVVGGALAFAMA
jgi:hypothetical protein